MSRVEPAPRRTARNRAGPGNTDAMLILGVVLLILGFVLHIQVLWIIGIVLAVIGAVLLIAGTARTGGRRWY
jgi:uncharacterized membrane protein HdeD (DUF308 family)